MNHEMLHGKYEALTDILNLAKLETGAQIQISDELSNNLQHRIAHPLYEALDTIECNLGTERI